MKNLPYSLFLKSKLLLLLGIACTLTCSSLQATTTIVFPTPGAIQAAVNSAAAGDTLLVTNGTYNESVNLANASGSITISTVTQNGATVNGGTASAFFAAGHTGDITIAGFRIVSSLVDNNAGAIDIENLDGRLTVASCTFTPGATVFETPGIGLRNMAANLETRATILNNTFGDFDNDDCIEIQAGDNGTGGDADILISGNSNTGALENNGVELNLESSNATAIVVITDNTFSGWTGTGSGISLHIGFGSPVPTNLEAHFLIEDNTITDPDGDGIQVDFDGINTRIFGTINNNTVNGSLANTEIGIDLDDDSSGDGIEATVFVTNNIVSNTLQSCIKYRPFNDDPGPAHDIQLVIDGNRVTNPNSNNSLPTTTGQTTPPEEAGIDISDDSGIDDEKYVINAEITNNIITVLSSNATCILVEEPTTTTAGTAIVNALISGNTITGCTGAFIRGNVDTSIPDPVPSTASLGSIGDFVWNDANGDGIQNAGEQGIPGVAIAFTNGSFSGTTTTNLDGNYTIPALLAGTYTLTITPPATIPFLTGQSLGGDAALDSDFDQITNQATVVLAAGINDVDIDAGLSQTAVSVCPTLTFSSTKTDEICPGANDGTITINSPTGGMAPYTFSADSGANYFMNGSFGPLPPGVYQLRVQDANGCESDAVAVTIAAGVDTTDPVIICPAGRTAFLDTNCDAALGSYSAASVTDNCSTPTLSQSPAPGTIISTNTNVTLTATDASNNSAACNFLVIVSDTIAPNLRGSNTQMVSLNASADATLNESFPNNNMGIHSSVLAGTTNASQKRRGLLKFDIAGSVPVGAIIDSVSLSLAIVGGNVSNGSDFDLFASLKDWNEGTGSGNNGVSADTSEVTWTSNMHMMSTWAAPGGQAGTDYDNIASATATIAGLGSYSWKGMEADVQAWLNNPASNFGWFLISQAEGTAGTARRFSSKEGPAASQPVLEVYYSIPSTSICGTTDTLVADTSCMAVVFDYGLAAVATDNCSTPLVSLTSPFAGSMIPLGTTVAQLEAIDASGNFDTCSFNLLVIDATDPEIVCPADTTVFLDGSGTALLGDYIPVSATDNCSMPTISQSPVGTTTISTNTSVTLTATDASGNMTSCDFMVNVETMPDNIDGKLNALRVQAYPNPTEGMLNIKIEGADIQAFSAEIFDMHGKLYMRKQANAMTFQMDLQGLAAGVYFLKVRDKNGLQSWEKVVLE